MRQMPLWNVKGRFQTNQLLKDKFFFFSKETIAVLAFARVLRLYPKDYFSLRF